MLFFLIYLFIFIFGLFFLTQSMQPADRRFATSSERIPVAVVCWEEFCGDRRIRPVLPWGLASAACFEEQLLLICHSWVEYLGTGQPVRGAERGMCVGSSCLAPAEQLHCYKMQLLLFWYLTQLSNLKFFVYKPDCFVSPVLFWPAITPMPLPVLVVSAELAMAQVGDATHAALSCTPLASGTIVMTRTTARQNHCT